MPRFPFNPRPDADQERLELKQSRQKATFEAAAVKEVMRLMGHSDAEMRAELRESRDALPTFVAMRDYLAFPMLLGVAKLFYIHTITMEDLFRRPTKLQIWRAYRQWRDEEVAEFEEDAPGGIIFTWPTVGKFVCLHNLSHDIGDVETRVTFGVSGMAYTIESLKQLVGGVLAD